MGLGDAANQREPQPVRAGIGASVFRAAIERLENLLLIAAGKPGPSVLRFEGDQSIARSDSQARQPTSMADGIVNEIGQRSSDQGRVAQEPGGRRLDLKQRRIGASSFSGAEGSCRAEIRPCSTWSRKSLRSSSGSMRFI